MERNSQTLSDGPVGVEHDSEGGAHGSGREVLVELGSDEAVVSVRLGDSAPDNSEFCVVPDALALVNVSDPLAEVEGRVGLGLDALDLEQRELLVLGGLSALEPDEGCLLVQSTSDERVRLTSLAARPLHAFALLYPSLCNNDY